MTTRVLVVDDDPAVRSAVSRALRVDYDVDEAERRRRGARPARRRRRPTRSCSTC